MRLGFGNSAAAPSLSATILALSAATLALSAAVAEGAGAAGYKEAPAEIEITIGRNTHLITEGVTTNLEVNGRQAPVRAVRRPSQRLQIDNFSFNYPSSFTLLSSRDSGNPDSASWMLKGKTCQITVHRKEKGATLSFLTNHMAEFYEGLDEVSDLTRTSTQLTVRGKSEPGVRFIMTTRREGRRFQDYFQLPVHSSRYTYFLVIHSTPGDPLEQQARNVIGSTFR